MSLSGLIRHALAIAVLPVTVTVLVPVWIARRYGEPLASGQSAAQMSIQGMGLAILCVGVVLFATSLRRFASDGRGTLAPWDPPRRLVVRGPYRYVRNPMISGIIAVLLGESLVLLSWRHGAWALVFLVLNLIYIPLFEEPLLEARFGDDYRDYCRHVSRFLPRRQPWEPRRGGAA